MTKAHNNAIEEASHSIQPSQGGVTQSKRSSVGKPRIGRPAQAKAGIGPDKNGLRSERSTEVSPSALDERALLQSDKPSEQESLSTDMLDAYEHYRSNQLASRTSRVALALSQLMRIKIPYPLHIAAMAEIEELRLLGQETRGQQQLCLNIFSATGTGKSTVAKQYKLIHTRDDPEDVKTVIHARLGTTGTARDLYVSILAELGDGFAGSGTAHTLRRRAIRAIEDYGVTLVMLDETQHSANRTGFSREITSELKTLLDTGIVPFVLLGTEAAIRTVGEDRELSGRMMSPCRLDPLNVNDDEDFELWRGFLEALDRRMVQDKIVHQPAGLGETNLAFSLGEACNGVIGQVMRVMTMALRNTIREGRDQVTIEDLAIAINEWSLEHGFAKRNPLLDISS